MSWTSGIFPTVTLLIGSALTYAAQAGNDRRLRKAKQADDEAARVRHRKDQFDALEVEHLIRARTQLEEIAHTIFEDQSNYHKIGQQAVVLLGTANLIVDPDAGAILHELLRDLSEVVDREEPNYQPDLGVKVGKAVRAVSLRLRAIYDTLKD